MQSGADAELEERAVRPSVCPSVRLLVRLVSKSSCMPRVGPLFGF